MTQLKNLIKKLFGKKLFSKISPFWHGSRGLIGSFWFGRNAQKMSLVGITGTKGKTSTTILTGRLLNELGHKTAFLSTALTFDGNEENQNPSHMSTIDPWKLQKFLQKCYQNGCQNVVLELSSQGLEQNRHWGLGTLKVAVFLNIYPEHLQAHGSWENYRRAKSKIFRLLKKGVAIVNGEIKMQKNSDFMLQNSGKMTQIKNGQILKIEINEDIWQIKNGDNFYKTLLLDSTFLKLCKIKSGQIASKITNKIENENISETAKQNSDLTGKQKENDKNQVESKTETNIKTQNSLTNSKNSKNPILTIPTNFVADYEVKNLVFAVHACQSLLGEDLKQVLPTVIPKIDINVPGRMEWIVRDNLVK